MTKEEAIETLKFLRECSYVDTFEDAEYEALDMAISALSENKGDLISGCELISVLHNNLHALIDTDQLYQLYKDINRLPTYSLPDSAENKGEWIKFRSCCREYKCSNCEYEHCRENNFCPNCGADMRGE